MFPRKYLPLLLMMLPFISGFSDHWLRTDRPWKKWPLQPKVAFSADVISRTNTDPPFPSEMPIESY